MPGPSWLPGVITRRGGTYHDGGVIKGVVTSIAEHAFLMSSAAHKNHVLRLGLTTLLTAGHYSEALLHLCCGKHMDLTQRRTHWLWHCDSVTCVPVTL